VAGKQAAAGKVLSTSEKKAHEYLLAGRVDVVKVSSIEALVRVQGTGPEPYTVKFGQNIWHCGCPAHTPLCAHVIAAQLVVHKVPDPELGAGGTFELGDPGSPGEWFDKQAPNPAAELDEWWEMAALAGHQDAADQESHDEQ
jgi:hypothetical protein